MLSRELVSPFARGKFDQTKGDMPPTRLNCHKSFHYSNFVAK